MTEKTNSKTVTFGVGPDGAGQRLDVFCASRLDQSRNQIQIFNERGEVLVDGAVRPDHYRLKSGETVSVRVTPATGLQPPAPQHIDIAVVFEDEHIVVVNKPAGLVVHPGHGNPDGTVVNALLGRGTTLSTLGDAQRPGVVHRLDKDTSGLMVLARTDGAYQGLSRAIKQRAMEKVYHAIAWGNLGLPHRTIDAPIARHPVHRQKMTVPRRGGRQALTEVFVVDSFEYFDYIRVVTLTGRTHQIRVHLAHVSHPILGDSVYGGRQKKNLPSNARVRGRLMELLKLMPRQALHASRLSFAHPMTAKRLDFRTALPEDIRTVLEKLHVADTNI